MSLRKRIINYRPLALIALCALLSITAALFPEKIYIAVICFACGGALLLYAAASGKYIALSLMIAVSVFSFLRASGAFTEKPPAENGNYYISCRVSDRAEYFEDSVKLWCTGIKISDAEGNAYSYGDAALTLPVKSRNDIICQAQGGDRLSLYAEVNFGVNGGGGLYIKSVLTDAVLTPGKPSLTEAVRARVKEALLRAAPEDTAGLMYAMLFGDKSGLSDRTYTAFQFTGLAHILAVSGFNVDLLALSVFYLMRKAKAPPWLILAVTAPVLGFYCALCSFVPSVMRASVMSVVFLTSKTLGKRYDPLNALAFSALAVTAIDYKAVISLSFQMSFMCMLSIIAFMPVLEKLFRIKPVAGFYARNRATRSVCRTCALSAAAQIGVLPLMINSFNYIAVYNIFANILAAPVLAVAVCLLYAAAAVSLIVPPLSFCFCVPAAAFALLKGMVGIFSLLPFAALTLIAGGALLYAIYLLITVCGRFVMCAKGIKWGAAALAVLLFFAALIPANLPLKTEPAVVIFDYGYGGEAVVVCESSAAYAGPVNSFNKGKIKEYFFGRHIRSISVLALTEFKQSDAPYVKEIVNTFKPEAVFVPDTLKVTAYDELADACAYSRLVLVNDAEDRAASGISVRFALYGGALIGVGIGAAGKNITFIYEKDFALVSRALWALPANPDLLIAKSDIGDSVSCKEFLLCYDYARFSNSPRGNFTYGLNNGIISAA